MSKRYDARVQIQLETVRPLTVQQFLFAVPPRAIAPGRYEFQLNGVHAVDPVVAIVAAERAAANALRKLGIDDGYEFVKVGAELTKGRTG